ncbi:carbon storage regulator CsrA [Nocardioides dubius]|uniref:Translational regulator CsrA n=1 Tax=Nocardioides dubius TaxID=317019 RepID=A0ABP4EAU4_9ACTN
MLVLSRKAGESVLVGDDIEVTILEIRGDVVRVGIAAPRSVSVQRSELIAQVSDSNRAAASPSANAVASLAAALRKP